jgi:hypothetical protein
MKKPFSQTNRGIMSRLDIICSDNLHNLLKIDV